MSEGHAIGRSKHWEYCSERTFVQALKSPRYGCIVNHDRPPPPPLTTTPVPTTTDNTTAPVREPARVGGSLLWLWILLGVILLAMILFLIGFATRREQKRRKIIQQAREQLSRLDGDARSTYNPSGIGGFPSGTDARSGYSPLSAYPSNVSGGARSAYSNNVSGVGGVSTGPRSNLTNVGSAVSGVDSDARSKLHAATNSTLWSRLVGGRSAYSEAPSSTFGGVSTATASGINSAVGSNVPSGYQSSTYGRSNLTNVPQSTTSVVTGTDGSRVSNDGRSTLTKGASGASSNAAPASAASGAERSNLPSKLTSSNL